MTSADRFRLAVALVILTAWVGLMVGAYGDKDMFNTATPIAFLAATFLLGSPLLEARRESRRTREQYDDERKRRARSTNRNGR